MDLDSVVKYLMVLIGLMVFGYFFGAFVSGIWNVMYWDAEGRLLLAIFAVAGGLLGLIE
jgi:hypothetical protein